MKFTDGSLSWAVCDDLKRSIQFKRMMLQVSGARDFMDRKTLEEELSELYEKTVKGTPLYRVMYDPRLVPVKSYEEWIQRLDREKSMFRSPANDSATIEKIYNINNDLAEKSPKLALKDRAGDGRGAVLLPTPSDPATSTGSRYPRPSRRLPGFSRNSPAKPPGRSITRGP